MHGLSRTVIPYTFFTRLAFSFHPWVSEMESPFLLYLDTSIVANSFSQKSVRMAYTVEPDETAFSEPFHLELLYLQRYQYWSAGGKN